MLPFWRNLSLALSLGVVGGCYAYTPMQTAPPPGTVVSFELNDPGRVALGQSIGPSAEKIEGALESATDSSYVLKMQSVTFVNGQQTDWTGEHLVVGRQFVTNLTQRQFSSGRTTLAVLGGIAAAAAFVATRSVLGGGNPDTDGTGGGPPTDSFRALRR